MVRKRERATTKTTTAEAFIQGGEVATVQTRLKLDPDAPHNFKAIKLGMNEFEYDLFTRAAKLSNRGLLSFIRAAAKEQAKKVFLEEKKKR